MPEKLSRPPEQLISRLERFKHAPRVADAIRPMLQLYWEFTKRHPEFWVDKAQLDALPKGAYVLATKHGHDDDIIATSVLLKGRNPKVPAKIELFDNPVMGAAYKMLGAIPLVRPVDWDGTTNWKSDVKPQLGAHLNSGEPVFIFPEGTRYRSPFVGKLHPGAADLAAEYRVPLIPVGYANTHMKGQPIAAWIGEPIEYPEGIEDPRKAMILMHRQLTERLPEANAMAYEFLAHQTGANVDELIAAAQITT